MNARAKIAAAQNGKKPKRTVARTAQAQRDLEVHAVKQQLKSIIEMSIAALAMVDYLAGATPPSLTNGPQRPSVLMGNRSTT